MSTLKKFAWLSVATAIVTIALKVGAWWVTGSVGLLSDALESLVNLVAAVAAFVALRVVAKPADAEHNFGHAKAEYFSAVFEGVLIVAAAIAIIVAAVDRLLHPAELESVGLGLAISVEDAHLHDGKLEAWGEPGHGSVFRLTLPKQRGRKVLGSPLPLKPPVRRPLPGAAGDPQQLQLDDVRIPEHHS